jgi:diadenylate cyclase
LSDETDALVVVVSEERATISVAERGQLFRDLTPAGVRDMLAGRAPQHVVPTAAGVPA